MAVIHHLKLRLRQDADLLAVAEIVAAFSGAILDDENFVVYYNTNPRDVSALVSELLPFRYDSVITVEEF